MVALQATAGAYSFLMAPAPLMRKSPPVAAPAAVTRRP